MVWYVLENARGLAPRADSKDCPLSVDAVVVAVLWACGDVRKSRSGVMMRNTFPGPVDCASK